MAAFIDFKPAYDRICINKLLYKLKTLGIGDKMCSNGLKIIFLEDFVQFATDQNLQVTNKSIVVYRREV